MIPRFLLVSSVLCLLGLYLPSSSHSAAFQKSGHGILDPEITCIKVHPRNPQRIFVGTSKALYLSDDAGLTFRQILQTHSNGKNVRQILIPFGSSAIYAAAGSGLFVSVDDGETWAEGFSCREACYAVWADHEKIFVGTDEGLRIKERAPNSWMKTEGRLGEDTVFVLVGNAQNLFAATASEVYRLTPAGEEVKVMDVRDHEANGEAVEDEDILEPARRIFDLMAAEIGGREILFVATVRGIFASRNGALSWEPLSMEGLPYDTVNKLIAVNTKNETSDLREALLIATEHGLYEWTGVRWDRLYEGLESNVVLTLAGDASGRVFAGTDKGLFVRGIVGASPSAQTLSPEVLRGFDHEPVIAKVQQWAVAYAHADPRQIKQWHARARAKAFVPNVSVGIDRAATELFHWDTGANPDNLVRGREFTDWDVSLSWNLGDFIWSNDHTSIDSRSKLMSEFREDLLDQVTRLYFERRRIQMELLREPVSDPALKMEKEMRVEELTALLDGLTGGQFSRHAVKKSENSDSSI